MKQNYISLIILLISFQVIFSMEEEQKEEIKNAVEIAKQIMAIYERITTQPNLKLKWYGEMLQLRLECPSDAPPICKEAQDKQTEAINTMIYEADEFKRKKEYNKALSVYLFAPATFVDYIEKLQPLVNILPELKRLTDQNKYEEAYKKLDELTNQGIDEAETFKKELQKQKADQDKKAQLEKEQPEREEQKKVNDKFKLWAANAKKDASQALQWYGRIVQEPIPPSITVPDPYKEAKDIQTEAFNEILKEANKLITEQKYKEALATYQLAPNPFYNNLAALKKRIAELPDLIKQQEQKKSEQERQEIERKKLEQERAAQIERERLAEEQIRKQAEQLTEALNRFKQERREQERLFKEAEERREAQERAAQAEELKRLEQERREEERLFKEAEKRRRAQEQATQIEHDRLMAQLIAQQEQARLVLERLEREKLEQERIRQGENKAKELKNALILLTNKLKLLAKIISHIPL